MSEASPVQNIVLTAEEKAGIYLVTGEGNPELGQGIADEMGIGLGNLERKWHADGEPFVRVGETILKKTAIVVQSHLSVGGPAPSELFMQHLGMIKSAAARDPEEIIVVSPYTFGARSEKEEERGEAAFAVIALDSLKNVGRADGVKRTIVTVDHHASSMLTHYDPAYNLKGQYLLEDKLRQLVSTDPESFIVVSPDEGHSKPVRKIAKDLGLEMEDMEKVRDEDNSSTIWRPKSRIKALKGKKVLMVDDMVDTAGTIVTAAEVAEASGAEEIYVAATHLVLSEPAITRIDDSPIKRLVGTNTLRLDWAKQALGDRLEIIPIQDKLAQALNRIITGRGSVSKMNSGTSGGR